MSDLALILKGIAPVVREFVDASVSVFTKRLDALEARPVMHGKDGKDGEKGEAGKDAPAPDFDALAHRAAALVPIPKDGLNGKDAIAPDLDLIVTRAVALIAKPKDGAAGPKGDPGERGERGESGLQGISPDVDALAKRAADLVLYPPDGLALDKKLIREIDFKVKEAIAAIPLPKDGTNGKDGANGLNGKDADPVLIQAQVDTLLQKALAAMPPPLVELSADDVTANFTLLLRSELSALELPAPKVQKRVIRDSRGQIERVVEEPA